MIVGEAPGFNEDRQGEPFVGAAGKLLDGIVARLLPGSLGKLPVAAANRILELPHHVYPALLDGDDHGGIGLFHHAKDTLGAILAGTG